MEKQNRSVSWTPFTDNLKETAAIVDNEMESSLKELALLNKAHLFGLVKKRGFGLCQVMFAILIWPLLSSGSLRFFCGSRLSAYIKGGYIRLPEKTEYQLAGGLGKRGYH